MALSDHTIKLEREKAWYRHHEHRSDHPLNANWLFSWQQNAFNYGFPKSIMANALNHALEGRTATKILIAPLGRGEDLPYLRGPGRSLIGIDISPEALAEVVDNDVQKYEADLSDIRQFPNESFDAVCIPLFFHHFIRTGFDPFLRESYRLLKPGGVLISLEPSLFYPLSWITRSAKTMFGNITGQVEDEGPFIPRRLVAALLRSGFTDSRVLGAGLAHNRTPIPLARIINFVTRPLLNMFPLNHMCWMCVYTGRKPGMVV